MTYLEQYQPAWSAELVSIALRVGDDYRLATPAEVTAYICGYATFDAVETEHGLFVRP